MVLILKEWKFNKFNEEWKILKVKFKFKLAQFNQNRLCWVRKTLRKDMHCSNFRKFLITL